VSPTPATPTNNIFIKARRFILQFAPFSKPIRHETSMQFAEDCSQQKTLSLRPGLEQKRHLTNAIDATDSSELPKDERAERPVSATTSAGLFHVLQPDAVCVTFSPRQKPPHLPALGRHCNRPSGSCPPAPLHTRSRS